MSDDEYGAGGGDDYDYGGPAWVEPFNISVSIEIQSISFQLRWRRFRSFFPSIPFNLPLTLATQDENYDILNEQDPDAPVGEDEAEGQVNGINGEHDQEMANGERPVAAPTEERQPNKTRITTPYLTKYERARILGTRALQIRCVLSSRHCIGCPTHSDQYERPRTGPSGWRDRCPSNCYQGVVTTQNTPHHQKISPGRKLWRLERLWTHHWLNSPSTTHLSFSSFP